MNACATTAPRSRTQLGVESGAKLVMLVPILLNRLLMLLPSNVAPPAIASAIENDQHCIFGRGRAAIVTAKAFEQSEHVHTPEIEPVTDPFAPSVEQTRSISPGQSGLFLRSGSVSGRLPVTYVSNFVWFATEN